MNLKLIYSELQKPIFVLNNIKEKIYFLQNLVDEYETIPLKLLTTLINMACIDEGAKLILQAKIIEKLMSEDKIVDPTSFLWLITNISLTNIECYKKIMEMNVLGYIYTEDIYTEYKEIHKWALKSLVNKSFYYNTQILYIYLKMEPDIIHNYLPSIYKLCKDNKTIIYTFILEGGLTMLYNNYEEYYLSSGFLKLILEFCNQKEFIIHIYNMFYNILIPAINLYPSLELFDVIEIILKYIDISEEIKICFMIDNLEDNQIYYYYILKLLTNPKIKKNITNKNYERILDKICDDIDDVSIYSENIYGKFLLSIDNIFLYDNIKLRNFTNHLESYKKQIYNKLDNTLKKKCLTFIKEHPELELPWLFK